MSQARWDNRGANGASVHGLISLFLLRQGPRRAGRCLDLAANAPQSAR
jgi:hypothetical protein